MALLRDLERDPFHRKLARLRRRTERAGVLTPTSIGIVQVGAVEVVERTLEHWRQMGRPQPGRVLRTRC